MKFTVPIPEKISLNKIYGGVHWNKRSSWKNDFHLAVMVSQPKPYKGHFPVDVNYHFKLPGRLLDTSNHFFLVKLIEDGFVACGVFPDDSPKYVRGITVTAEKSEACEVIVELSPTA